MQLLKTRTFLAVLLLIFACAACGPKIIQGRPPFISIASLSMENERLKAVFTVSNQNGEPMDIRGIDIRVQLEETELTQYNEDFSLTIDANSAEDVTVEDLPDDFTRDLLASLEQGDIISIPFELDGRVNTLGDGTLRFSNKGHLYPVPGRPGQFRSATTHSSRIDSDDPFKEVKN